MTQYGSQVSINIFAVSLPPLLLSGGKAVNTGLIDYAKHLTWIISPNSSPTFKLDLNRISIAVTSSKNTKTTELRWRPSLPTISPLPLLPSHPLVDNESTLKVV